MSRRVTALCNPNVKSHDCKTCQGLLVHTRQQQQNVDNDGIVMHQHHQLHFGYRMAIGLAGTTNGAPSKTLKRRPYRGILKQYSLKKNRNRIATINVEAAVHDETKITSTAMEPEIGFLMANLALGSPCMTSKKKSVPLRILDPCCGSGRLLLYIAALVGSGNSNNNNPTLVGVDYNPKVWEDSGAIAEFETHHCTPPLFIHGDVTLNPQPTEALSTPDLYDAIICDPPYNIGAPALGSRTGGKDTRVKRCDKDDDNIGDNESSSTSSRRIISSIISIAETTLKSGGRIVFFRPVRGDELSVPLEELLQKDLEACCPKFIY